MSTPVIAAGAAAFGLYIYLRQRAASTDSVALDAWRDVEHPPNTWGEAFYYFKEVLRYMYSETLGRWHTVDLLVGLAYLSQRETLAYAALDIANRGRLVSLDQTQDKTRALLEEMKEIQRYLLYCRGLKYRKEEQQSQFWQEHVQLDPARILSRQANAGLLRPAYVLLADDKLQKVVLCIRGTQSMKDMFTSLAATTKPHHKVQAHGVVMGYSHLGMLAAARWLIKQVTPAVRSAMAGHQGYGLTVVGHSMGAGTAALLTTMLRETVPECADARCYALACPACMTLELATSCKDYVTSVINGTDIVPTFSSASVDALREDVMHSAWFVEFQRDLRSSMSRAVQGSLRGVGMATQWTASNILQPAYLPFTSCYIRTRRRLAGASELQHKDAEPETTSETYAAEVSLSNRLPSEQQLNQVHDSPGYHHQQWPAAKGSAWAHASHMGGTLSAPQLRRRLWPWGSDRELGSGGGQGSGDISTGSVSCDAAASVAFAGWLPDVSSPEVGMQAHGALQGNAPGTPEGGDGSSGQGLAATIGPPGSSSKKLRSWSTMGGFSSWLQERVLWSGSSPTRHAADERGGRGIEAGAFASPGPGRPAEAAAAESAGAASPPWLLRGMFRVCMARRQYGSGPAGGWRQGREAGDEAAGDSEEAEEEEEEEESNLSRMPEERRGAGGDDGEVLGPGEEQQLQQGITAVVSAMAHEEEEPAEGDVEDDMQVQDEDSLLRQAGEASSSSPLLANSMSRAEAADAGYHSQAASLQPGQDQGRVFTGTASTASRSVPEQRQWSRGNCLPGLSGRAQQAAGGSAAAAGPQPHSSHQQSLAAPKRHLYPAGRILHLFPQNSIPGVTGPTPLSAIPATPDARTAAESIAYFAPTPQGMRPTASDITSSRMAHHQGPYALMEVPDNQAYGRVKLCRTMVLDHLTPSYLTAVGSVVRQLEAQLQEHEVCGVAGGSAPDSGAAAAAATTVGAMPASSALAM